MEAVRHHITKRQARLGEHPFFDGLERDGSPERVLALTPALAFWARALRDVLQANAERGGPAEDDERRYFEDVERLMGSRLPPSLVASDAHPLTREASYQLLYEVLASKTDGLRIVLLTSVEATRELFHQRVGPLAASLGEEERFHIFEQYHGDDRPELHAGSLTPDDEQEALALVDRVFAAFDRMFHGFAALRG